RPIKGELLKARFQLRFELRFQLREVVQDSRDLALHLDRGNRNSHLGESTPGDSANFGTSDVPSLLALECFGLKEVRKIARVERVPVDTGIARNRHLPLSDPSRCFTNSRVVFAGCRNDEVPGLGAS